MVEGPAGAHVLTALLFHKVLDQNMYVGHDNIRLMYNSWP